MSRTGLLGHLRRHLRPFVPVPTSPPTNDRDRYLQMIFLIRAWRANTNERLRVSDAQNQEAVADEVVGVMHSMFEEAVGCGDLCYDRDRGCIECRTQ